MNLSVAWSILSEAISEWIKDNAPRLAAALAFYTILSVAPLLAIATAIVGTVFGKEAASGQLISQLREIIGEAGAVVVSTAIEKSNRPAAGLAGTIGVLTLLFGASGVLLTSRSTQYSLEGKAKARSWFLWHDSRPISVLRHGASCWISTASVTCLHDGAGCFW